MSRSLIIFGVRIGTSSPIITAMPSDCDHKLQNNESFIADEGCSFRRDKAECIRCWNLASVTSIRTTKHCAMKLTQWSNTADVIARLYYGVSETNKYTGVAVLDVFNGQLNVRITPHCIDHSHRLGRQQPSTDKPRPVIVKFVSCESSQPSEGSKDARSLSHRI